MHHLRSVIALHCCITSTQYLSSWQRSSSPLFLFLFCLLDNQNFNTVLVVSTKGVYLHYFCSCLVSWTTSTCGLDKGVCLHYFLFLPCLIDNHWIHSRDQCQYLVLEALCYCLPTTQPDPVQLKSFQIYIYKIQANAGSMSYTMTHLRRSHCSLLYNSN